MANEYLKRTPTSTGNRKVFTWSGWIKLNEPSVSGTNGDRCLFSATDPVTNGDDDDFRIVRSGVPNGPQSFYWNSSEYNVGGEETIYTNTVVRDVSSWQHVILVKDSTQTTSQDRVKIYVNGVKQQISEANAVTQNADRGINSLIEHNIGEHVGQNRHFHGEMCDVFFIDGQALTPDVFGFYKDGNGYISAGSTQSTDFRPGQWVPKAPRTIKTEINRRGGFGVNGFYLPMNDSSNFGADFHTTPNSIITLKGEDLPQPRNGLPTTSDNYVSQLREDPYAANLVLAVPGVNTQPTGSELITNGTFDTNVSGWTITDTGTIVRQSDGTAKVTRGSSAQVVYQDITTVVGTTYELSVDITDIAGSHGQVYVKSTPHSGSLDTNIGYSFYPGTFKGTFTADTTTTRIILYAHTSGSSSYDNISVKATTIRDYHADIKGSGTNKTLTPYADASVRNPHQRNGRHVNGYYGSALTFDGTNDYFTTPNSSDFYFNGDFTVEAWIYRRVTNTTESIVGVFENSSARRSWVIETRSNSAIRFQWWSDGSSSSSITSANNSVPGSQWNHIAMVKNNDTITGYVNGVAVGADTTAGSIYENTVDPLRIGILNAAEDQDFNGYIQDLRIYKGVAKYKGGFDVPKPYAPENGNTNYGIETWRQVSDTCKNNFATFNPEFGVGRQDQLTYSNGNLRVVSSATSGSDTTAPSNMAIKGKIYCEFALTDDGLGAYIGVMKYNTNLTNNGVDTTASSDCWIVRGDNEHKANGDGGSGASYGTGTWSTGDIIMLAVDIDNTSIWWGKNGTWYASGNPSSNSNAAYTNLPSTDDLLVICGDNYSSQTPAIDVNFGQNPTFGGSKTAGTYTDASGKGLFKYAPPTGFLALCEDNLPTPAIADPGDYFKTVLWTGDGNIGRSITGVGFKPDLVWIKSRTSTIIHYLFDTIRGAHKGLDSSSTTAEVTSSTWLQSFDDNGFSIGGSGGMNGSGNSYVAWCWKAGGAAVANTDGSINSSVSANQTAGFSIVSYTGTGSAGTVGHGLGKRPKVVIVKRRDASTNWPIFFDGISNNTNDLLQLNLTNATATAGNFFNSGNTTTTTFPLGTGDGQTNASGSGHIAYCWAEIEGYSKFGSYRGNGNVDGPFVYCGFKPAWIMIKPYGSPSDSCYSGGYTSWSIYDSSRNPVNSDTMHERVLFANRSYAEGKRGNGASSGAFQNIDIVSNGFKIRGQSNCETNTSSIDGFIFMAFAESPFQTANAK